MVEGSGDDTNNGGRADEGAILSPNELDITESEHVEQIDEGRFVVSPETRTGSGGNQSRGGGDPAQNPQRGGGGGRGGSGGQPAPGGQGGQAGGAAGRGGNQPGNRRPRNQPSAQGSQHGQLTESDVRRWLRQKYERSNSKYAFDVTAQFDGAVSQRRLESNDLITVFESLMLWYGQQVDSNMPVEEVLGILLMESNVPIRYPPESVENLVKSTDLGPNDTIADLLEAVRDDDGVKL
ncbi:hypothetical protein GRX03_14025 [Halovenus sp. WSH3]|uniref:DIX domain-containing protein n=1 Tax=Halovenus carboxidivorans TaxID=2692199 RepID=A0A6B0THQ3_9EURY|nr:hypothetical protein [Halovenus carboxidivorans]MXR52719.1 hypothetical protein [Halovenus carboxidivorans]